MKRSIIIILFIFCASAYTSPAQNNSNWHTVKDTIAAYLISFPEKPTKEATDVDTQKGAVKMNTYSLQSIGDENIIYFTSYTKYPDSFFQDQLKSESEQNTVLENSVKGAITNTKGKLIYESKITFNGYQGRIIKIDIGDHIIKMKTVLVGISLYIVQVIYKKENDDNANAKRFFESFELINIKE